MKNFVAAALLFFGLSLNLSVNSAFAQSYSNVAGTWRSEQKPECGGAIQQNGSELYFKACQYESRGRFVDGRTIVADQWGVRGTISSDANRIEWTNGNVWTRGGSQNPKDCGLGTVWDEYESGWIGKWTRRGASNVFDARWEKSGWSPIENYLTISISGSDVSIHRQDPNISNNTCTYKGKIASDGVSVSGEYTCNDRGNVIGPLNWSATIRCSDGNHAGNFAGEWNAHVENGYTFTMSLRQDGNRVTGTHDGGRTIFEGVMTGKTLRFRYRYKDNSIRGAGTFVLSDDGRTFSGFYSHTDDPDNGSKGFWKGTRR